MCKGDMQSCQPEAKYHTPEAMDHIFDFEA
jgi:hypothetical protein